MIYELSFAIGLHGLSKNNRCRNSVLVRTTLAKGNAGFKTIADAASDELRKILCSTVTIINAKWTPQAAPGATPYHRGDHMTYYQGKPGLRTSAGTKPGAYDNLVAIFGKNSAYGDTGIQPFRGCYFNDEVTSDASGAAVTQSPFTATPFTAFGGLFLGVFTSNASAVVLPNSKTDPFDSGHRPVTSMVYTGPSFLQKNKSRDTIDADKRKLVKRELNDLNKTLEAAQRDAFGNIIAIADFILTALKDRLLSIIQRYGEALLSRVGIPTLIRTLLFPLIP